MLVHNLKQIVYLDELIIQYQSPSHHLHSASLFTSPSSHAQVLDARHTRAWMNKMTNEYKYAPHINHYNGITQVEKIYNLACKLILMIVHNLKQIDYLDQLILQYQSASHHLQSTSLFSSWSSHS